MAHSHQGWPVRMIDVRYAPDSDQNPRHSKMSRWADIVAKVGDHCLARNNRIKQARAVNQSCSAS